MTSSSQRPGAQGFLVGLLLSPLFAVYGLVTLARGAHRLVARLVGARQALATNLRCPNGAGAGWVECDQCGVGIRLPWVTR
jgi:hypothetical protein